ncbi:MAG: glycosyltransferase family 4 protein [Patescibacteria group bacterium]|nr:glycosyltransferase family 4 protein [Patescibacteria group bacterium]
MRILISFYSPWWNAPAYYAVTLTKGLVDAGHDVIFLGQQGTPAVAMINQFAIPCRTVHLQSIRPDRIMKNVWEIHKTIKNFRPDIINNHSPQDFSCTALTLCLFRQNIPVVRTRGDHLAPNKNYFNNILYNRIARHLIFPSEIARNRSLLKVPMTEEKTSVIYSGLDIAAFRSNIPVGSIRSRFAIDSSTFLIGMVCRLSPVKGLDYFLETAKIVLNNRNDVKFVISGEDAQITKKDLRNKAEALDIGKNVIILDKVPDPRMVMADLDVGIVASQDSEMICRVAAEFMAMSKPLVVTRVNVLPEMVDDGVTGFVCDPKNPQEMALSILKLLSNQDLRIQMGTVGFQRALKLYDIKVFISETIKIYQKVC